MADKYVDFRPEGKPRLLDEFTPTSQCMGSSASAL